VKIRPDRTVRPENFEVIKQTTDYTNVMMTLSLRYVLASGGEKLLEQTRVDRVTRRPECIL
jgi:hypothetical protein